MAALQPSLAQQHSRSLLRRTVLISKSLYTKRNVQSLLGRQRQHIAPSPWQTSGSSTAALAAASAATAALPEPDRLIDHPLQRLCKNVLVGVAATAAWSVAASICGGSSSSLASLTIAFQPGASSTWCMYCIKLCMHGPGCPAAVEHSLQAVLTCCGARSHFESSQSLRLLTLFTGAQVAAQSAWAGLAAGFLHTLCGPDHLAVSGRCRTLCGRLMKLCIPTVVTSATWIHSGTG
jgi:hypothetical protein